MIIMLSAFFNWESYDDVHKAIRAREAAEGVRSGEEGA
jgi:head-tail adaptor